MRRARAATVAGQGSWIRRGAIALVVAGAVGFAAGTPAEARSVKLSNSAILRAGVMRAEDVPTTWGSKKQSSTASVYTGLSPCRQINTAETAANRRVPRARSAQFDDPQSAGTTLADDTVYAFPSASAAGRYLAAYQASSAAPCLQTVLAKAVGSAGTATVVPLTAQLQGLGDANAGYEGTIQGTNHQGQAIALVADLVTVRVGRAVVTFEFLNANVQIPQGPGIVDAVVRRLQSP
jgi:hypothetical protein